MTPEGKVKEAVKKLLKKYKCYYVMPMTRGMGSSGAPDFLVCAGGRFVGVETKAGAARPTQLQLANLQAIESAKGVSLVINESNLGDLEWILKSFCPKV
jgi:hypothetical protein